MNLFEELDRAKTAENVIKFFKLFPKKVLQSVESLSSLKSPSLDGMPKVQSALNNSDYRLIEKANAAYEIEMTLKAIRCLDIKSQFILNSLYITRTMNNNEVFFTLNYGRTRYYELKEKALCSFAEAYSVEDLRIFKSEHLANTLDVLE